MGNTGIIMKYCQNKVKKLLQVRRNLLNFVHDKQGTSPDTSKTQNPK